jgi:hypothetical protein
MELKFITNTPTPPTHTHTKSLHSFSNRLPTSTGIGKKEK